MPGLPSEEACHAPQLLALRRRKGHQVKFHRAPSQALGEKLPSKVSSKDGAIGDISGETKALRPIIITSWRWRYAPVDAHDA